jgi:signal transduction histidine kinase
MSDLSRPGAARGAARVVRAPRRVVVACSILVLALLGVFAFVLASSQSISRHEAEQRFGAEATIAAGLTNAILATAESSAATAASRTLAGPVSPAGLDRIASQSGWVYLLVTDGNGRTLAASADAPAPTSTGSGQAAVALRTAQAGRPWFSSVETGPGGTPLVVSAIPFATPSGRRIELVGDPVSALAGFFRTYLSSATTATESHSFVVDSAGRILGSSVAGVKPAQLASSSLRHVLRAEGRGTYHGTDGQRYVATAPITGASWRLATTEPTSQLYPLLVGSRRWLLWLVFAAFALAAIVGLRLLARTLSATAVIAAQGAALERTNAALRSANAELDAFSYSVSHDLRSPLRAIDGFSRIVVEEDSGQLTDDQRRYLGLVRDSTQTMGQLIDDLLELSRLSTRELQRRPVATANVVAELADELTAQAPERDLRITVGELPEVKADPVLIGQVFANLLQNAAKYTRERSPALIGVSSATNDGELVFTVQDNGVGFDMRYADKLFDVFQRLHRAEDYEGTGVGLAIVQRVVARHGGRIWADASPGEGAAFHFTLGAQG